MRNLVARLLLGATFVGALSTAGCYASGTARTRGVYVAEVQTAPPPPRVVHVRHRPGYAYVQGRWTWDGYEWRWVDGHYVRARPGYVYDQGRWVRRGGRYVWVDGGWRARGDSRTYVNTYRRHY